MTAAAPEPDPPPKPSAARDDVAVLANALLGHALEAFKSIPESARGSALAALDRFLAAPGPAAFVAAARELREARRRFLVETRASGTLRRALEDGVRELGEVPGLPEPVAARLAADLPIDALTGPRLRALALLARAYEELAARVAADTDEMRRRYKAAPHRRRPRGRNHL
jgi:hypothetical protein